MIPRASTTILVLPLLGVLQGVHGEQIVHHGVRRGKSGEHACNRGVSQNSPDGDVEHVAGSLLQRIRAVPVEVEDPDEESPGESSNTSLPTQLVHHEIGPDENVELPPQHASRIFDNSSGSTSWLSWTQSQWQLPSLAQLSQHALVSRGKNTVLLFFARGELSYIVAALTVSLFVVLLCVMAHLPRDGGPARIPIHQLDPVPRTLSHLHSNAPLRPGTGLGSALSLGPSGPVMHSGMPPSMASLPSVQAMTTAPASCAGLHPRRSFEQALNVASRMSMSLPLPSLKEMRPQLCVELVVPPGKECCLQLPTHPFGALGDGGHIAVNDVQGRPVFDVGFVPLFGAARSRWGCFAREDQKDLDKRLVLRSAVDSYVFGSCKAHARPDTKGGRSGLTLCNSSENPFGVLQQDISGSFMMKALDSWFVKITDCGQAHHRFEDSDGWILASVEGGDDIRIARIAPQVDAGLIVLVMLGIDLILQGLVGE